MEQYLYDDNTTSNWGFALNLLDLEPKLERLSTMIHEFAHLLSLGKYQVTPYISEDNCQQLHIEEGCIQTNSYLQAFYDQFWTDTYGRITIMDQKLSFFYDYPELVELRVDILARLQVILQDGGYQ